MNKVQKSIKIGQNKRICYLLLRVFWLVLPKFSFWKIDSELGYFRTEIRYFSIFPNSQRPSVSNCSAACGKNTFTESVILDIKLRFTCVESNLY